ncbi:hypothetical protein F5Y01DRAFT_294547 [Xylaria sp. FL0043]|nr:hypothetical protein F5Y01DRAFT_294547 [Xylaria sp. FL0043]
MPQYPSTDGGRSEESIVTLGLSLPDTHDTGGLTGKDDSLDSLHAALTCDGDLRDNDSVSSPASSHDDPDTTWSSEDSSTVEAQAATSNSDDTNQTSLSSINSRDGGRYPPRGSVEWWRLGETWEPPHHYVWLCNNDDDNDGSDEYDSDDSCASHDSFISNLTGRVLFPCQAEETKPYRPPEHYDFFSKNVVEKPRALGSTGTVQKIDSDSRLEKLPPELRIQILSSMPDLETLRSMINASPVMHAQYLHDRHTILSACLDHELDGFYVDAYANMKSRPVDLGWARSNESITKFLDSYNGWLTAPNSYPCTKSLPPSRVRWMAAYHIAVARPLVRRYSSWALQNLRNETTLADARGRTSCDHHNNKLSQSEEVRIFRALYRLEVYCHVFGLNMGCRDDSELFDKLHIYEKFLCIFHPWEAEAIACLHTFLRDQWHAVFVDVRDCIRPDDINWKRCGDVHDYGEEEYDLYKREDEYTRGMISRGLKVFMRILVLDNHHERVSAMERCLMSPGLNDNDEDELQRAFAEYCDYVKRHPSVSHGPYIPDAKDEAQQRRDPMGFRGDSLPADGPPLAWVHVWDGRYVNKFGDIMPESLNRCGYVMWDARRWDGVGDREFFTKKWLARPDHLERIKRELGWTPVAIPMSMNPEEAAEQS